MPSTDKVFLETLNKLAPNLSSSLGEYAPGPLVFSDTVVSLSLKHWTIVKDFISLAHRFSRQPEYKNYVSMQHPLLSAWQSKNQSVMMSYDFHVLDSGPKLIEVNTNASLSSYASIWTETKFPNIGREALEKLLSSFEQEAISQGIDLKNGIFIVDEHPEKQKAFGEFIIFKDLFIKRGWPCKICDVKDLKFDPFKKVWTNHDGVSAQTVYNRWNDFTLSQDISGALLSGWKSGLLLTPQPIEYVLLADKQRIVDWRSDEFSKIITLNETDRKLLSTVVPITVPIKSFDPTAGRPERAKWFFKPRNSFGSRGVYEGSKISNKVFENILREDYLAQEAVPPPVLDVEFKDEVKRFKWDLRVYVYRDQVILPIARLYIGQTTNSQNLGGGLAAVQISSE